MTTCARERLDERRDTRNNRREAVREENRREDSEDETTREAATREDLIAGLNEDLSWEFNAVISYRLFASLCTGPYRQELRKFFEAEIADELLHAQFLADKIVALGRRAGDGSGSCGSCDRQPGDASAGP